MELNKIAAAILLAGLIGMVTSKLAGFLYGGDDAHHGEQTEIARGYAIDVPEDMSAVGAASAEEESLPSIIPLLASADVAAGEAYFAKKCTLCHSIEKGGPNLTGPNLWNIVGTDIGSHDGFNYSSAMSSFEGSWNFDILNGFLHKPKKYMPGTIMAYAGIRKEEERANVIAYLRSMNDNPPEIPPAPAADVPEADVPDDATLNEDAAIMLPAATTEQDANTTAPMDEEALSGPAVDLINE